MRPEIGIWCNCRLVGVAVCQPVRDDGQNASSSRRPIFSEILYMAAVSASVHNRTLRAFYRKLLAKGKPKKVALVAVARKLLLILNEMAKENGRLWPRPCNELPESTKRKKQLRTVAKLGRSCRVLDASLTHRRLYYPSQVGSRRAPFCFIQQE